LDQNQFTTKDNITEEEEEDDESTNATACASSDGVKSGKDGEDGRKDSKPHGAVDHLFNFGCVTDVQNDSPTNSGSNSSSSSDGSSGSSINSGKTLLLRELPISRADNPFGDEQAPEDDTTGSIFSSFFYY
jgi:hypothetical protein